MKDGRVHGSSMPLCCHSAIKSVAASPTVAKPSSARCRINVVLPDPGGPVRIKRLTSIVTFNSAHNLIRRRRRTIFCGHCIDSSVSIREKYWLFVGRLDQFPPSAVIMPSRGHCIPSVSNFTNFAFSVSIFQANFADKFSARPDCSARRRFHRAASCHLLCTTRRIRVSL